MKRVLDLLILIPLCKSLWRAADYMRYRATRKAVARALPSMILLIAAAACQAATGVAPNSAFTDPTSDNIAQNADFWSGYSAGEIVPIMLPDGNYPTWWDYIAAVRLNEMPRARAIFFVINYNVGFDSAEETAANYFWTHWETSCGIVVCNAANVKRRIKPPMEQKHLDLVGKGVKGVTTTIYRGARVIL